MSVSGREVRQKRIAELQSELEATKATVVAGVRAWAPGDPFPRAVNDAFKRVMEIGSLLNELNLQLQPSERFGHGQVYSYVIALPNEATAILDLVGGRGWRLTIRDHGATIDRGLFGSTDDIVELLSAEYFQPSDV